MKALGTVRSRPARAATLVIAAGAGALAAVGAFVGNRAVLGAGLAGLAAMLIVTLKAVMEAQSATRSELARLGARVRNAPSPSGPPSPPPQPAVAVREPAAATDDRPAEGLLELYTDRCIAGNDDLISEVREALIEHHFRKQSGWTEDGGRENYKADLDRHAFQRHDTAVTYVVPWVNQAIPLAGKEIVEIGCGTGSSTAAFAPFAARVHGYDISESSLAAAEVRLAVHGLRDRVELVVAPPADLLSTVRERHASDGADIVLLYALLEHQTVDERLDTLRLAEQIVRPGGAIVVTETPNRLTYVDRHTSLLPFFHLLPIELQLQYAGRSPRASFAANIAHHRGRLEPGDAALRELMIRWGQSVSYHDFEIALGDDIHRRVLVSGNHPNMRKLRPECPEEAALRLFLDSTGLSVHPGFTRPFLDLVLAAG